MYQSVASLFHYGVQKSFEEYIVATSRGVIGDGSVIRPARAAIEILHSFGQHYETEVNPTYTPIHIEYLCPGYKVLQNLSEAAKHTKLTRGKPVLSNATQIEEAVRFTTFRDREGLYINTEVLAIGTLNDGAEIDVLEVMSKYINFWGKQLFDDRLMNYRYYSQYMGEQVIPRHLIRPPLEIRSTVGIGAQVKYIPRYYDYRACEFKMSPHKS